MQNEAGFISFPFVNNLNEKFLNDSVVQKTKLYLDSLSLYYSFLLTVVTAQRDAAYENLVAQLSMDGVYRLKQDYYNEDLANLLLNKGVEDNIIEINGKLIQKKDPIFIDPRSHDGRAHFYAPVKILGTWKIDTFWFNFAIIWMMTFILYLTLLHDSLRKSIGFFERILFKKLR